MNNKIVPYEHVKATVQKLTGKKTVIGGGCFDVIHYGHIQFLSGAKAAGEILIILLESDEFIHKTKNKQPVHSQTERMEILSHIDLVDIIIPIPYFVHRDYYSLIREIQPYFIAVSKGDPKLIYKKEQAISVGARLIITDYLKKFSSSKIIKYAPFSGS